MRRFVPALSHKLAPACCRGVSTSKITLGAGSAFVTSTATLGMFHLIVSPVSAGIAAATLVSATASGAFAAFEGGKEESGSSFGAVMGLVFGGIGGYYAKSCNEPWR